MTKETNELSRLREVIRIVLWRLVHLSHPAYCVEMDVSQIVSRFIEAIAHVDKTTSRITYSRKGIAYLPGIHTMNERDAVAEAVDYWRRKYPRDFEPTGSCLTEHPYPESRAKKADIVFSAQSQNKQNSSKPGKWAVEVKRYQFVGDNGKNNDFGVAKMFSPYLKDRSLSHDAERLAESEVAERKVVLVYGFEYDLTQLEMSRLQHPLHHDRIDEIEKVCRTNNPDQPGIDFDLLVQRVMPNLKEVVEVLDFADLSINGLWRHPCGGKARVIAWEVKKKAS